MNVDTYIRPSLRDDMTIQTANDFKYATQRGRICNEPGCNEPVRYTKDEPYCGKHEPKETKRRPPSQFRYIEQGKRKTGPPSEPLPRLKEIRAKKYRYASQLAAIAGVEARTVQKIERGRGATKPVARKLARALGVRVEDLK